MTCRDCNGEGSHQHIEDSRTVEEPCDKCEGYGHYLNNEYTFTYNYNPFIEVNLK